MLSTLRNKSNYDFGKYLCPKCSQILCDAVQTSCGHWLCQLCADEIFRDDPVPKCLHADCNELLTEENKFLYFPDRFVRKEVNKIPVECPSTQHGCTWTGRYGEMKSHIQECSFARTACLYCNQRIPTQQMSMHKKICQMRVEQCPFVTLGCKQEDKMSPTTLNQHLTDDLVVHLKIVAEYLLKIVGHHDVKTENITENITDDGIASTDSSLSLLSLSKMATLVERDGSGDNSIAPYRGREEDNLVPTYLERNFQLLAKGANYKAELDALRANLHTKDSYITSLQQSIALLEKQVQAASSQSEDRDFRLSLIENINYDGSMIWKIPQFSQRMEDARSGKYTSIFSLPFYSGRYGYKMCLRLYILGDGIGKNTHMSLFFVVMKGEFDAILQWPFTHKVSFCLINQHHGRDIVDVFQPDPLSSSFQRPKTDMNVASGCPRFISLAELNQGGFIEDNTIFIKVKVDVSTIKHP